MVQGPANSLPPDFTLPSPSSSVPPPARSSAVSATLSPGPSSSATRTRTTTTRMALMSPTYDRLEAGRPQPGKQGKFKRFAWKKFALGAGVLLALVWLFVPREKRGMSLPSWGGSPTWEPGNTPYEGKPPNPTEDAVESPPKRPSSKPPAAPPNSNTPHPASFETDLDPSKTTHCTTPHSSASSLVQYALMIDAGGEVFKQTEPREGGGGLSAYKADPAAAAASLTGLLDEAMRVVPAALRKCTPVQVKATAGLRQLPEAEDLLAAVEAHIRTSYPFALPAKDSVVVMDGADEGVFAWVTANYLLGALRPEAAALPKAEQPLTYAVLDLGGASTQIVFAPKDGAPLHEGEHKYDLEFNGETRVLIHRVVEFMAALHDTPPPASPSQMPVISNPCLSRGTERVVELVLDAGAKKNVTMDGGDVGGFDACRRIVDLVLAKDAVCAVRPCAFGGVYQPALSEAFPPAAGRVLLLSYFYDRVAPLVHPELELKEKEDLPGTVDIIRDFARIVCQGRERWLEEWGTHTALIKELEGRPEWCLDLTFMHGLLQTGYEFEGDRGVTFGKKIEGTELGWCLGAGIKLVGGVDVQCRV
ncbi:hypothetical protein MVEN_00334000 [Mycena venus]|uniref:guanosine-diphosphatase n=1 Tax=Mycena venus TaxID=2733690 RepID=A0A8H7DAH8_9AGAR|nr:hypothetical protein MVEN_00334000 [Mycena venus]